MNFREQLKDPTEAMKTLFDKGLVVMEGDENITDKDLTDFASHWGELCPQASKFWYNGNSKVAELSAGKMFGTSELGWHKDSSNTKPDYAGTMLYNKSETDIKSSTFFVGTTTYNNPDKYKFFYHTWGSNHTLLDEKENRIGGACGFNMRTGEFHVFRAKAVVCAAGGASHIFKPRAVGEGMGRTWYAPWSSGSAYALPIQVGAKMTQMENRIVLTRFKDGYGPVLSLIHI